MTIVDVQLVPKILKKTDSKIELACLIWTIYIGKRKLCVNYKTDSDKLYIVINRYRNNIYLKVVKMEMKMTGYDKTLVKKEYLLSYLDLFFKRCIILNETSIDKWNKFHRKLDVLISICIIRLYAKIEAKFLHNIT